MPRESITSEWLGCFRCSWLHDLAFSAGDASLLRIRCAMDGLISRCAHGHCVGVQYTVGGYTLRPKYRNLRNSWQSPIPTADRTGLAGNRVEVATKLLNGWMRSSTMAWQMVSLVASTEFSLARPFSPLASRFLDAGSHLNSGPLDRRESSWGLGLFSVATASS